MVIVAAAVLVALASKVPPLPRAGACLFLAIGLLSCIKAWIWIPLMERRVAVVYASAARRCRFPSEAEAIPLYR
jgi:hypothetical protein